MSSTAPDPSAAARLERLARQFLVHAFLYYRLGEPVIDDTQFDRLAEELRALRDAHPEAPLPHGDVLAPALGPEASGHRIRSFPEDIVSDAFKLLYATQGEGTDFVEFVERRGYRPRQAGSSE